MYFWLVCMGFPLTFSLKKYNPTPTGHTFRLVDSALTRKSASYPLFIVESTPISCSPDSSAMVIVSMTSPLSLMPRSAIILVAQTNAAMPPFMSVAPLP